MKNRKQPQLKWEDLNDSQREEVVKTLSEKMPYREFEFVNGLPVQKGKGGSDADFVEVSCIGLFELVTSLLHRS